MHINKILVRMLVLCNISFLSGYTVVHHHESRLHILPVGEKPQGSFVGGMLEGFANGLSKSVARAQKEREEKERFNKQLILFEDRGYNTNQAKIYANMAIQDPNGFAGVVQHMENQQAMHQQMEYQKKINAFKASTR